MKSFSRRRILSPASLMVAAALLGTAPAAQAATLTWDTNTGTTGAQAGSGTWTTTSTNWWNATTSLNQTLSVADTAGFTGTDAAEGTYVVTVGANVSVSLGTTTIGGLDFKNNGFILTGGGTLRTITMGNTSNAGFITVAAGKTAVIGNNVDIRKGSTSGQLDLYGGGTLVIASGGSITATAGQNTSFIMGGSTLEIRTGGNATYNASLVIGQNAGGGNLVISGGNLSIGSTSSNLILHNAGAFTSSASFTINSGTVQFTNAGNTVNGLLRFGPGTGSTSVATNLTGTVNLNGGTVAVNRVAVGGTFTGGVYNAILNFNGGTLKARMAQADFINLANSNSSSTGAFVKAGGAIIDSDSFSIGIAQALLHDAALGATLDGGLTKLGLGTLTLSGTNTYTGATTISAGTLSISADANLGAAPASATTGSLVINGSTLASTGTFALSANRGIALGNSSASTGGSIDVASTQTLTYGGILANNGGANSLTKTGNGTLVLSGANSFTGGVTINAGILQLGNTGALNGTSGSENTVAFGAASTGVLALAGNNVMVPSLTTNVTPGSAVVQNANGSAVSNAVLTVGNGTFAGVLRDGTGGGTLGLTKDGNGTLTLNGANTHTGATTISGGKLVIGATGSISGSTVTLTQGTLTGAGNVGVVNVGAGTGGIISNNDGAYGASFTIGSLTFAGAATVNTFSDSTSASIVTTSLATNAGGVVTINPSAASWTTGSTYDLISFTGGSIGGAGYGQFQAGVIAGLATRQSATLGLSSTAVTLVVAGDNAVWSGANGSAWTTSATNNWALKNALTATDFLTGDLVEFKDTVNIGGTIAAPTNRTVDIRDANVSPYAVVFDASLDYELTSLNSYGIIGAGGLTKRGSGNLTITAFNDYTGDTVINGGKILLGFGGSLSGESAALRMTGGALDLGFNSPRVGAVTITVAAPAGDTIANGTLKGASYAVSNAAGNVSISAILADYAIQTLSGFTKTGAGSVTLSGTNTYSGTTTINGGLLTLSGSGTLGTQTAPLSLGGGRLDLGGTPEQTVGAVTITAATVGDTISNGTLKATSYAVSNSADNVAITAVLADAAAATAGFTKTGAGTVTLSALNTFTGSLTINGGVLSANTIADTVGSSIGLSAVANNALAFGATGGTLRFIGASGSTTRSINFAGPAVLDVGTDGTLTLGSATPPTTTSGAWSGAGSITKSGNGILTVQNNSTAGNRFTVDSLRGGNFTMQVGTLNVTSTQHLTIGDGGVGTAVFTQTGGVVNFTPTSAIAGNDVWIGNATVPGQLIVSGGTFNVASSAIIRVGQATAGTLNIGNAGGTATVDSPAVSLGNNNGNGVVNLYANGVLITSALRDGAGAGTSTVNFDGGTLRAKSSNTSFMPTGFNTAAITANGLTTDTNSFDITIGQALGGVGRLTKTGNGVLTLSGTNTYAGGTTLNAGTLALSHATDTLANAGAVDINGGTLQLGSNSDTVGAVTLTSGAIAGTGVLTGTSYAVKAGSVSAILAGSGVTLTKDTAGTVTLTGANTYTGVTTITGGTLALSGDGSVATSSEVIINGSGAKFVNAGVTTPAAGVTLTQGTLTGSGTINTANVAAGGVVSNNDGAYGASLTITSLNFAGAATINTFSSTIAPALLSTTLSTNAAGIITINPSAAGWENGATYELVRFGSVVGAGDSQFALGTVNGLSSRQSRTFAVTSSAITLSITGDNPYWLGATSGWNTSAQNNWRLVTAGTDTAFATDDGVLFNDSATGSTTVDIDAANVNPVSTIFDNSTKDYVLSSSGAFGIASGGLTKRGSGKLTITNANTYSGPTSVTGGTLELSGSLGSTAITVGANATFTQTSAGVIGGTASLTTSGTVTLAGANTYSGGTNVSAGTLTVGNAAALGAASGAVTVASGAMLDLNGTTMTAANPLSLSGTGITAAGALTNSSATAATYAGVVTLGANGTSIGGLGDISLSSGLAGSFSLLKVGNGKLTLTSAASRAGATQIDAGVVRIQNALALSTGITAVTTINNGGVLEIGAAMTLDQPISLNGGATLRASGSGSATSNGTITIPATGSPVVTLNTVNTSDYLGIGNAQDDLTGGTATSLINVTGLGIIKLSNSSNYAGNWSLQSGTTRLGGATSFGTNASVTLATGATLAGHNTGNISYTMSLLTVSGTGTATLLAGRNGNGPGGFAYTFSGPLSIGGQTLAATNSTEITSGTAAIIVGATTLTGTPTFDVSLGSGGATSMTLTLGAISESGGSQGLNKTGNGILALASASTYTGVTTISNGLIQLGVVETAGVSGPLGVPASLANSIVLQGGGLRFTATNTYDYTTGGRLQLADGATGTIDTGTQVVTFANSFGVGASATGALTKLGGGTLVMSGANTYKGVTTVSEGILRVTNSLSLGDTTGGTIVANNARIELDGGVTVSGEALTISGPGGAAFYNGALNSRTGINTWAGNVTLGTNTTRIGAEVGATMTVSGVIDSGTGVTTGPTIRTGGLTGVVVLSGASTYVGDTNLFVGTLRLAGGDNRLPVGTKIIMGTGTNSAEFDLNGRNQEIAGLSILAGATAANNSINNSSTTLSTLTMNTSSGSATSFAGLLKGNLRLAKSGADDFTLSGTNTFTGGVLIHAGALVVGSAGALNSTAGSENSVAFGAGNTGTLRLNGFNVVVRSLETDAVSAGTPVIENGGFTSAVLTVGNTANASGAYAGVLQDGAAGGALGLTKTGNGTLTLTGANTYSGNTTISAGGLVIGATGSLPGWDTSGRYSVAGGATLGVRNGVTDAEIATMLGTTNFAAGAGLGFDTTAGNRTYAVALADTVQGALGLTKAGNNTLELTGTNSYTGVTRVNAGTLKVSSLGTTGSSSIGASDRATAGNLQLNGAVRLEYAGAGEETSRSFTVSGTGMTIASSGSGAVTFTPSTNIAFATDGASARELRLAGNNTGDNTYAATAAGSPAAADVFRKITKNEVGKWIIAGSGTTYADNLQVEVNAGLLAFGQASLLNNGSAVVNSGGTLQVNGTNANASVTVNSGGTLGGGASLGAVNVNNGGALSPGNSPGTFTSTALTLAGGSIINWQVMDALGAAGIGYDHFVTGQLDLTGASSSSRIILKISSITALDVNGNPDGFWAPSGVGSIRTFQLGQVNGGLLNNGRNISDVFAFDVDDFRYSDGSRSNAALWSISWDSTSGAITLTAVPEPSTYGLGLGALALAAAALRRRRKQTTIS